MAKVQASIEDSVRKANLAQWADDVGKRAVADKLVEMSKSPIYLVIDDTTFRARGRSEAAVAASPAG